MEAMYDAKGMALTPWTKGTAVRRTPWMVKGPGRRGDGTRGRMASRSVGAVSQEDTAETVRKDPSGLPFMLRALNGESVERPPVWMMRQAGRYMKVYQDLCVEHPTFRERSESVELSVEITLQPWKAFRPDGVVLFSDILTPLPGMNIPFDIVKGKGPIIHHPIRTMEDVEKVTSLDADDACPFVGKTLRILREELKNEAAVLGFVGAPYTLASYIVEGGTSKRYTHMKELAFGKSEVLHALLDILTKNVTDYCKYQAESGAQVIQIFDSWASSLAPQDFDVFSGPYLKRIISDFKRSYPDVPVILYISGSGGLLERMAKCGADVISVDHSVDMIDAIERIGGDLAVQGNLDPGLLFGSKDVIEERIIDLVKRVKEKGTRHIMNLGHGVWVGTPEENVAHYFEVSRTVHERL